MSLDRCGTCVYNTNTEFDDGVCYECIKGISDRYEKNMGKERSKVVKYKLLKNKEELTLDEKLQMVNDLSIHDMVDNYPFIENIQYFKKDDAFFERFLKYRNSFDLVKVVHASSQCYSHEYYVRFLRNDDIKILITNDVEKIEKEVDVYLDEIISGNIKMLEDDIVDELELFGRAAPKYMSCMLSLNSHDEECEDEYE